MWQNGCGRAKMLKCRKRACEGTKGPGDMRGAGGHEGGRGT